MVIRVKQEFPLFPLFLREKKLYADGSWFQKLIANPHVGNDIFNFR